jgi:hypothetical protein
MMSVTQLQHPGRGGVLVPAQAKVSLVDVIPSSRSTGLSGVKELMAALAGAKPIRHRGSSACNQTQLNVIKTSLRGIVIVECDIECEYVFKVDWLRFIVLHLSLDSNVILFRTSYT